MSSITLKLSSLVIRTLSKPIANQIKAQAREHERFRRLCVSFAQSVHRMDVRLRLGLLQSTKAMERQAARDARDAARAQSKKHKQSVPTVKTEEQTKADEAATAKQKDQQDKAADTTGSQPMPRIRPLSEAKAIDTGANFISESFLFLVAGGLIVFESLRARRKETSRREDVADRLGELEESEEAARKGLLAMEKEVLRLRAQLEKQPRKGSNRILPREVWDVQDQEEEEDEPPSLLTRVARMLSWGSSGDANENASTSSSSVAQATGEPSRHSDGSKASAPSTGNAPAVAAQNAKDG